MLERDKDSLVNSLPTVKMKLALWLLFAALAVKQSCVDAKVQVVFMGGQSNCQGIGDKPHLRELIVEQPEKYAKYGDETDSTGSGFATRNDVFVINEPERQISGPLRPRFGDSKSKFGIELGMGWELGDHFEEMVLIVKHCEVFPLAAEWRPPSSGTPGLAYQRAMDTYRIALDQLGLVIPGYDGSGYDIMAFVWMHGYADVYNADYLDQYEVNLQNLLNDVKSEFPDLQGNIIVQTGGGGESPDSSEARLREIQERVADNDASSLLVETSQFAGGPPIDRETYIHYFGRADNYVNIGENTGEAIIKLEGMTIRPTAAPSSSPTTRPIPVQADGTVLPGSATSNAFKVLPLIWHAAFVSLAMLACHM